MPWILLLIMLSAPLSCAQTGDLYGSWSATYGQRVFQGSWTLAGNGDADTGWGAWRLLDPAGKTLLSGTWSMRKVDDECRGSWRAEVKDSTVVYTGTWTSLLKQPGGTSRFRDMFEAAAKEVVSGAWAAPGGRSGAWSIRAVSGK